MPPNLHRNIESNLGHQYLLAIQWKWIEFQLYAQPWVGLWFTLRPAFIDSDLSWDQGDWENVPKYFLSLREYLP